MKKTSLNTHNLTLSLVIRLSSIVLIVVLSVIFLFNLKRASNSVSVKAAELHRVFQSIGGGNTPIQNRRFHLVFDYTNTSGTEPKLTTASDETVEINGYNVVKDPLEVKSVPGKAWKVDEQNYEITVYTTGAADGIMVFKIDDGSSLNTWISNHTSEGWGDYDETVEKSFSNLWLYLRNGEETVFTYTIIDHKENLFWEYMTEHHIYNYVIKFKSVQKPQIRIETCSTWEIFNGVENYYDKGGIYYDLWVENEFYESYQTTSDDNNTIINKQYGNITIGSRVYPFQFEMNLIHDTTIPTIVGKELPRYTNTSQTFKAEDLFLKGIFLRKTPSGQRILWNGQVTTALYGTYEMIAVDKAGNELIQLITVDNVNPTIGGDYELFTNITANLWGYDEIAIDGNDNQDVIHYTYKGPGSVTCTDGVFIRDNSISVGNYPDGTYTLWTKDLCNNESNKIQIVFDTKKPTFTMQEKAGSLLSDTQQTNKDVYLSWSESANTAPESMIIKLENSSSIFTTYVQNYYSYNRYYDVNADNSKQDLINRQWFSTDREEMIGRIMQAEKETNMIRKVFDPTSQKYNSDPYVVSTDILYPFYNNCFFFTDNQFETYLRSYIINDKLLVTVNNPDSLIKTEGSYVAILTDLAGNVTSFRFVIDKTAPVLTNVYPEFTNQNIEIKGSDLHSFTIYLKIGNGSYSPGNQSELTIPTTATEGKYSFYLKDQAGNESSVITITLDVTPPVFIGSTYPTTTYLGKYITNKAFTVNFTELNFLQLTYTINDVVQNTPLSNYRVPATGENGDYRFLITDKAGNQQYSEIIILDTEGPNISPNSGSITYQANHFSMTASDRNGVTSFRWTSGTTTVYSTLLNGSYTSRSDSAGDLPDGEFILYAVDTIGNTTTVKVILDRQQPVFTIDDSFVNTSVTVRVNATELNLSEILYRYESQSWVNFTTSYYKNLTLEKGDGTYQFQAKDKAGNLSNILTIVVDTVLPVITYIVPSAGYTNQAISFTATDLNLDTYQYKRDNGGWTAFNGLIGVEPENNATYLFRALDKAGNVASLTQSVILDTVKPVLTSLSPYLKERFTVSYAKSEANRDKIYYQYNDNQFKEYTSGTSLILSSEELDGRYTFYAIDKAGNESERIVTVLDCVAPLGELFGTLGEPTYYQTIVRLTWSEPSIYESPIHVSAGGAEYQNGKELTTDGKYVLIMTDEALNTSRYEFTIDRTAPILSKTVNDYVKSSILTSQIQLVETNKNVIYYSFNEGNGVVFQSNLLGTTGDNLNNGVYRFYTTDKAGNQSNEIVITLDTIKPVNNEIPRYTNQSIEYHPQDIYLKSVSYAYNDKKVFNELLTSQIVLTSANSLNGDYYFKAIDLAGNESEVVVSTLYLAMDFGNQARLQDNLKKDRWYLVDLPTRIFNSSLGYIAGKYSFASYEQAYAWALEKERLYRVMETDGNTYYCSQGNENLLISYDSPTNLQMVLDYYVKKYISGPYYYDFNGNTYYNIMNPVNEKDDHGLTDNTINKPSYLEEYPGEVFIFSPNLSFKNNDRVVPSQITIQLIGNNMTAILDEPAILLEYNQTVKAQLNIKEYLIEGYYLVTESDLAGNMEQYVVYLDLSTPTLIVQATYGDQSLERLVLTPNYITSNQLNFYFTSLALQEISDNIDYYSFLTVSGPGINKTYRPGEQLPYLDGETYQGLYTLTLFDRAGNVQVFRVRIAGSEPSVLHGSLDGQEALTINIRINDDNNILTMLNLYLIDYLGNYILKTHDDVENEVNILRTNYTLTNGGQYVFEYRDIYRRQNYIGAFFYEKGLPKGTLSVKNKALTNETVIFTFAPDIDYQVYTLDDGVAMNYFQFSSYFDGIKNYLTFNNEPENNHSFLIRIYNRSNYSLYNEYTFIIDSIIGEYHLLVGSKELQKGDYSNEPFILQLVDPNLSATYYTSNDSAGIYGKKTYQPGTVLSNQGTYYFTVKDTIGNTESFEIVLDSIIDYKVKGASLWQENYYVTNESFTLSFNEVISYTQLSGKTIVPEMVVTSEGVYRFYLEDLHGNKIELTIEISFVLPSLLLTGNLESGSTVNHSITVETESTSILYYKTGSKFTPIPNPYTFEVDGKYEVKAVSYSGNELIKTFIIDLVVTVKLSFYDHELLIKKDYTVKTEEELVRQELSYLGEIVEQVNLMGEYTLTLEDLYGNILVTSFYYLPSSAMSYDLDLEYVTIIKINDEVTTGETNYQLLDDGKYLIRYENALGKQEEVVLTVDNTPPEISLVRSSGLVTIQDNASEPLENITLYLDGEIIKFSYGKELTEFGKYTLVVEDLAGNTMTYEWEQSFALNISSWIVIMLAIGVLILAIIWIIRVKKVRAK